MANKKFCMWKYAFEVKPEFTLEMPKGARVRHVALQSGIPCLWAEVNPGARGKETKVFRVRGTGQPFECEDSYSTGYLGTFQQGEFVWHVFDAFDE